MALLKSAHGGNIREAAALLGICAEQLLDFSANINPLGMPESLKRAIIDNMACASCGPTPNISTWAPFLAAATAWASRMICM